MPLFTCAACDATPFKTVQDNAFPYLVFDSDTGPLAWTHGSLFALRLGARFLRITPRGMHYSRHMPLWLRASFHSADCTPSSTALCEESASRMLYFSTGAVDLPDDWRTLRPNAFVQRFPNGSSCSSDYTGRVIKTDDPQYEVSLCDLLDSNLDIILDTRAHVLHWRVDDTSMLDYFLVAVLAIYLISVVSQNMVNAMTHESTHGFKWLPQRHVENAVMLTVLVYTWASMRPSRCVLTTHADHAVFIHLSVLSVAYWGLNVAAAFKRRDRSNPHSVTLFTMGLLLLLQRVYQTIDMPYLVALVFLFGSRFVYKFIALLASWVHWSDYLLLLCESVVFASLLGAVWVAHVHVLQAAAMQSLILVACWMMGIFMYLYGVVYSEH
jgi:hypothetical protein